MISAADLDVLMVASLTAIACALPGCYLLLRRMSLLSDAISHSILLGIVLAFFLVDDLSSPLLVIGAALAGVLTVSLIELLSRSGRVREDGSINLGASDIREVVKETKTTLDELRAELKRDLDRETEVKSRKAAKDKAKKAKGPKRQLPKDAARRRPRDRQRWKPRDGEDPLDAFVDHRLSG